MIRDFFLQKVRDRFFNRAKNWENHKIASLGLKKPSQIDNNPHGMLERA